MSRLLDALHSGRVLLMDGAMGTELQRTGLEGGQYDLWNLTLPEQVHAVHRAYVDAGAEVLLTNTFQVVKAAIAWHSQTRQLGTPYEETRGLIAIQWSAYALSRSACGPNGLVLADIGSYVAASTGDEFSDLTMLRRATSYLGRVDGVLLETCSTPRAWQAVRIAQRSSKGLPTLLSLTYQKAEGKILTRSGHSPEWFAERARKYGLAALGVNCGRDMGMDEIIEVVRRYRQSTDVPLFARPNAGTPQRRGKHWQYPHRPQRMAAKLQELLEAGAVMVGGCCGTTPAHIAAFRPIVDAWNQRRKDTKGKRS